MASVNPYGYKPSPNVFSGSDVSSYWNSKGDSTNIPWGSATSYQSPYNFNQDFSSYWNSRGDTAGYDWNQAVKWNPSKDFLANYLGRSGLNDGGGGGRGDIYPPFGGQNRGSWYGGADSGFSSGNLLPGFSGVQPESAKVVGQAAGVQGTPSFGEQLLGVAAPILGTVAGSFLGPIGAAAGGAVSKAIFH